MTAVADSAILVGDVILGEGVVVEDFVRIGQPGRTVRIGNGVIIRAGSIVYGDVELGSEVQLGHHAVVREHSSVGVRSLIGSMVVLDGYVEVGQRSRLQTGVYVPSGTSIGDDVFIGPNAVLTNDKRMGSVVRKLRGRDEPFVGPTVRRSARIGANSTLLPEIEIGEEAVIGAGSVVTRSVPAGVIVAGVPANERGEVPHEERLASRAGRTGES